MFTVVELGVSPILSKQTVLASFIEKSSVVYKSRVENSVYFFELTSLLR